MDIPIFTVDAFTTRPFEGNPASVCIIKEGQAIDSELMQCIAREMNLSETAFVQETESNSAATGTRFGLRWFTPTTEVNLCGHATMASAAVLFNHYGNKNARVEFDTLSGTLSADNNNGKITINLPLADVTDEIPEASFSIIQVVIPEMETLKSDLRVSYSKCTKKLLVRMPDDWQRNTLESLVSKPDALLQCHDGREIKGVIFTVLNGGMDTQNQAYDFISRYFAPWLGIPEDPVTGAAHTVLGKYWSQELNKNTLYARQCSSRGGDLSLTVDEDSGRVFISGNACIVLSGKFHLP